MPSRWTERSIFPCPHCAPFVSVPAYPGVAELWAVVPLPSSNLQCAVGDGEAVTVTWTSSLAVSVPSEAVRRSTYTPADPNDATGFKALASLNVTPPAPLTFAHDVVNVPDGRSSSMTDPSRSALV